MEELKKLDESLEQEEAELVKQLEEIAGKNPAVKGDYEVKVPDYGREETEDATEGADLDRNFALEQELEVRLRKVKEAREKIKNGTYGTCAKCASAIPENRLAASPLAHLCIGCAQAYPRN